MLTQEQQLKEEELREIYEWVDTFDLSRVKRNINRDFADGVLVAEILSVYHPRLIEFHNYSAVNSLEQKIGNWKLLRKRVFKKIHFQVNDDEIQSLVRGDKGHIEIFLLKLKRFLEQEVEIIQGEHEEVKRAHRTKSEVQDTLSKLKADTSYVFDQEDEKAQIQKVVVKEN